MNILLDTHALIWFCSGDERLTQKARDIITNSSNKIYYSIVSILEVEIKHAIHPDRISMTGERLLEHCQQLGFIPVQIDVDHILAIKNLTRRDDAPPHRDPFDKLMLCQAIVDNMLFITHDERIAEYVSPIIYKI